MSDLREHQEQREKAKSEVVHKLERAITRLEQKTGEVTPAEKAHLQAGISKALRGLYDSADWHVYFVESEARSVRVAPPSFRADYTMEQMRLNLAQLRDKPAPLFPVFIHHAAYAFENGIGDQQ